jgi:UDP-GlcNAc:undecaprenyl-phosphate GlcNAc-1-phosphate transferase
VTLFHMSLPLIAFIAVMILMPVMIDIANNKGFVDVPGGRKKHGDAVPPIGGLVIFPIFALVSYLAGVDLSEWGYFYAALGLLVAIGAVDDRKPVNANLKFAAQFLAAGLIVIGGGAQVTTMGNILGLGDLNMGFMTIPFSVIAVVLLVNAINLLDGLDGLAGGVGFVAAGFLALACLIGGSIPDAAGCGLLMACLAGFLFYNMRSPWRSQAAVFLGDAGSLSLGLTISWLAIKASAIDHPPAILPMTIAWILALPIYDICGQFARRISQGRHPFDADHNHFHHHFINAGLPVGQATMVILFLVILTSLVGVAGMYWQLPQSYLSWPWIMGLFGHMYLSMRPHRYRRIIARMRHWN